MGMQSHNIPTTSSKNTKSELGQFYTSNSHYILQGMQIPENSNVIEPFAGDGQLVSWCNAMDFSEIECYDIDPKKSEIIKENTLLNPPEYEGKFVVTNPPYLARNKTKDKSLFEIYKTNDLYKCFISSLVQGNVSGGIIIVPLNFFCDDHCTEVRDQFLSNYNIDRLNIFEETVFEDTTYTVCSFQFHKSKNQNSDVEVRTTFFPRKKNVMLSLKKKHKWKVAGFLDKKVLSKYNVKRLVRDNVEGKDYLRKEITKIYLNGIDSGTQCGRIRLSFRDEPFFGKNTDRAFATLVIKPEISIEKQRKVIHRFNSRIEKLREEHNSLFLVNYRNSTKAYARKRIKFSMVYNMVKEILNELET